MHLCTIPFPNLFCASFHTDQLHPIHLFVWESNLLRCISYVTCGFLYSLHLLLFSLLFCLLVLVKLGDFWLFFDFLFVKSHFYLETNLQTHLNATQNAIVQDFKSHLYFFLLLLFLTRYDEKFLFRESHDPTLTVIITRRHICQTTPQCSGIKFLFAASSLLRHQTNDWLKSFMNRNRLHNWV